MQTKRDATATGESLVDISDLEVHFELRGGMLKRLLGMDTGTVKAVDGSSTRPESRSIRSRGGAIGSRSSGCRRCGRTGLGSASSGFSGGGVISAW